MSVIRRKIDDKFVIFPNLTGVSEKALHFFVRKMIRLSPTVAQWSLVMAYRASCTRIVDSLFNLN